jgi:hypothetical protein
MAATLTVSPARLDGEDGFLVECSECGIVGTSLMIEYASTILSEHAVKRHGDDR